jgi:hypothetical protein
LSAPGYEEFLEVTGECVVVLGLLFLDDLQGGSTERQLIPSPKRTEDLLQLSPRHRFILGLGSAKWASGIGVGEFYAVDRPSAAPDSAFPDPG